MQHIGTELKAARKRANLTQTEFAKRYGCSNQAISHIESRQHLSTKIIEKWFAVLGKTVKIDLITF